MPDVTVTYLEMFDAPLGPPVCPPEVSVMRSLHPTAAFYRFLYGEVGRQWHWVDRHAITDEELVQLIRGPGVEIHVLYCEGTPAGYCELARDLGEVKLVYFGLIPEFIGRGLGRFWLEWTVHQCWTSAPKRVWVHTCTLDHPRALPLYQKVGFIPYKTSTSFVNLAPAKT